MSEYCQIINNRLKATVFLLTFCSLLASCVSNKQVIYLQESENMPIPIDSVIIAYPNEYRLQKGDLINLDVRTLDPTISEIFNASADNNTVQLLNSASDVNYLTGFAINENGDLELPLIGFVRIEGLTQEEAQIKIRSELSSYIKDAYVTVRLGGIRYSALGEFMVPGRYSVLQDELTIFEAIANAGDLSTIANRKSVKLIRRYPDGQRIHEIDLTSRQLIKTPFYYIQPNDQIYVEPLKVRVLGRNFGVEGFTTFANVLSVVSSTVIIIFTLSQL